MFGFLVVDQDLQIIKIPFAVVAPRSGQDLIKVWVLPLWLDHRGYKIQPNLERLLWIRLDGKP